MEEFKLSDQANKFIQKVCEDEKISNYTTVVSHGSMKGDGYASKLFRVKIEGDNANGDHKKLHLILKTAPSGEKYRASFDSGTLFVREMYMYDTVLPEFQKLQDEKNIPASSQFKSYAKCYGGSVKHLEEVIVLENIKENNFELWNRHEPMPYEVLKMVFQEFGRLHALSFALRDQKPDVFKNLSENTHDIMMPMLKKFNFTPMIHTNLERALGSLDPIKDYVAYKKIEKLMENGVDVCLDATKPERAGKYAVIGHGDSWCNNMMFQFEGPKRPSEFCLLDWQVSRFASPVLDLSYFLFPNLKEAYDRVDELLLEYHVSLSSFLKLLGSDPEKLFPFHALQSHWKQFSVYGFIWCSILGQVMTVDEENAIDLVESCEKDIDITDAFSSMSVGDEYYSIVRRAIHYCVENDII